MREHVGEEGKSMPMKLWRVMNSWRQLKGWFCPSWTRARPLSSTVFNCLLLWWGKLLGSKATSTEKWTRKAATWSWEQESLAAKNSTGNVSAWLELQQGKRCQGAHWRELGLLSFDFLMQLFNIFNSLGGTWVSKSLFQIKCAGVYKWPPNCLNWALILQNRCAFNSTIKW